MNIYHYHFKTGEFLGEGVAALDPIDKLPLLPANSTQIKPPTAMVNEVAVWNGDDWDIKKDFRGYIGYDETGALQKINNIGVMPENNWMNTKPFIFADAKAAKQVEINNSAKAALSSITQQYTREEIDSWATQEAEANAYIADNAALTPLIDAMAGNRPSVDKPTLVSRILANSANYKMVSGAVIGKKHALEDNLNALDENTATQADIDAIVVAF